MRIVRFSALLILGLAVFTVAALAEEWKKNYTVAGSPVLQVETNDASIQVRPDSGNTISARVTANSEPIGPDGVRIVEQQTGDTVRLQVKRPHRRVMFGFSNNKGVQIEISVPQNTKVALTTSDGSLRVAGLRAPANLVTSDGSITAEDMDGTLVARTSNGSVGISGRFDNLEVLTSNGSIRCESRAGSRVNGGWNLRTSDGSIELRVPGDLAADLEAWTSEGRVNVNVPIMVEGGEVRNRVRGKLNGGGGLLKLHTSDGSITVNKL